MTDKIMNINGVSCYEENGTVYLKLEDVARGLGFIKREQKSGVVYESVRWERVFGYLEAFGSMVPGFDHKWAKDSYIPENIFYRLAMKANNDAAEKFQVLVADEIIPSIRRNGVYATTDFISKALDDPDFAIQMLQKLKEERAENKRLQETVAIQTQQIAEMQPKVSYYDVVLQTPDALPISVIAKDYGWSAQRLNQELRTRHVQYQQGRIWLLYQEHAEQGYTVTKTSLVEDGAGNQHSRVHTYWTQKGRLFIYDLLKKGGILPLIEREEAAA